MLNLEQRILLHHAVDVLLLLLQLAFHFVVPILSIFQCVDLILGLHDVLRYVIELLFRRHIGNLDFYVSLED